MTAFIDTDDLSDYIGSDATGAAGDFACSAACQIVEDFLDNGLVLETDVSARLDGSGTDALVLPKPPVRRIASVTEGGYDLTEDEDFWLHGAGILFRIDGAPYPGACRWPVGRGNVTVVYDRGFDLEGGSYPGSPAPIPDDIRLVALGIAKRVLASGALPVGGFTGETIGNYAYTIDSQTATSGVFDLQDGEKAILAKYQDAKVK